MVKNEFITKVQDKIELEVSKKDLNTIFDLVADNKISYDEMMKGLCYFSKTGINCAFVKFKSSKLQNRITKCKK